MKIIANQLTVVLQQLKDGFSKLTENLFLGNHEKIEAAVICRVDKKVGS